MSEFTYKKYSSSNISSPKTKNWIEKEHKNLLIQSRFSAVNQSIMDKVQHANHLNREISNSKCLISNLQERIERQLLGYQAETNQMRQNLQSISARVREMESNTKANFMKTNKKMKQIKAKMEIQLVRQRYSSENTLLQMQEGFQKMILVFKKRQANSNPEMHQKLEESRDVLNSQVESLKKQSQTLRQDSETQLDHIANELQKKISEWRKRMIGLEYSDEETLKQLRDHIEVTRSSIEEEMKTEREIREENKEKLLMLLQIKSEKLGKKER